MDDNLKKHLVQEGLFSKARVTRLGHTPAGWTKHPVFCWPLAFQGHGRGFGWGPTSSLAAPSPVSMRLAHVQGGGALATSPAATRQDLREGSAASPCPGRPPPSLPVTLQRSRGAWSRLLVKTCSDGRSRFKGVLTSPPLSLRRPGSWGPPAGQSGAAPDTLLPLPREARAGRGGGLRGSH